MHATIGNEPLSNIEGTFSAYVSDWVPLPPGSTTKMPLFWALEIEADYEFEHDGHIYSEPFRFSYNTWSIQERHWKQLTGPFIEWKHPDEFGNQDLKPRFCHDSHLDIVSGIIRILERQGCQFRITWDGRIKGYGEFSIDVWLDFRGVDIYQRVKGGLEAREVLERHLFRSGLTRVRAASLRVVPANMLEAKRVTKIVGFENQPTL